MARVKSNSAIGSTIRCGQRSAYPTGSRFYLPGVKEVVMKTISSILLFSMIFYCCSSTHMIMHEQSAYDELNDELRAEKGQITLMDNAVIIGENIVVGIDSTSWISNRISEDSIIGIPTQQAEHCISTSEIRSIVFKDNSQGAWEAFGFGSIGGIFALIIAASGGYVGKGPASGPEIIGAITITALAGGIIGTPIGGLIGHEEKSVFHQYVDIEVSMVSNISEDVAAVNRNGRRIYIPRMKIKQMVKSGDKIIITIPLGLYRKEFDK
jgi:hypothetical protein